GAGVGGTASSEFHVVGLQKCNDSSSSFPDFTMMWAIASVFPQGPTPKPLAGQMDLSVFGLHTAPNSPVISVLALGANPGGVPLGGVCQRLYVDLNLPY